MIGLGSMNNAPVDPGEVFELSIRKDARGVILVHNHPFGDLRPSELDKDLTDNLIQAGNMLNRPILDHVIITEIDYYSFNGSGLLDELSKSKKYALKYLEEKRIREEGEQVGEKRGEKKGLKVGEKKGEEKGRKLEKKEMAKVLKKKNVDTATIAESSGLSKKEIEKL